MINLNDSALLIPRDDAISFIRKTLGDPFLAYLLNIDSEEEFEQSLASIPTKSFSQIYLMTTLLVPILLESPEYSTLPGTLCRQFGKNISLLEEIRMENGAAPLQKRQTEDPLLDFIIDIAQRILPTFTLLEWSEGLDPGSKIDRYNNLFEEDLMVFESLLNREPGIETLIHNCEGETNKSLNDLCIATTLFPVMPLNVLSIEKSLLINIFLEADVINIQERGKIETAAKKVIEDFRIFINRTPIETKLFLLFDDAEFIDSFEVFQGNGILRPPTGFEKRVIVPKEIDNPLVFIATFDDELLTTGCTTEVLQSKENFDVFNRSSERPDGFHLLANADSLIKNIQFAILLAQEDDAQRTADACGAWPLMPHTFINTRFTINKDSFQLDSDKAKPIKISQQEFNRWIALIQQSNFPPIAIRRIVKAFSKQQQNDSLLDLLIALDCLFGAQSEITFKLSLCVSKLLHPEDEQARRAVFDVVKDAYEMRSKIVHGEKIKKGAEEQDRIFSEIRKVVIRVCRCLLTTHGELLSLPNSERIKQVALS